jgi:ligand-binding sensor domain-containing protein/signal transduction histidine kinase/DNA-binding response OmpR family regulator
MKSLLLTCFLISASLLFALDPGKAIVNYNIQNWNMESGLPGNAVFALRQTIDGYLWIGTQDGLVRFDGIRFEVFTRDTVPQLKSNDIRALYEDRNGVLWIGTSAKGVGLTRYQDGEFFTYTAAENNFLSRIRAIGEDRWGNLWIGSYANGLTCLNNGKFTTYTTQQGLPDNQVRFIYQDKNQDLWVTTFAGIVKVVKPGVFENYASHDLLPYLKTSCLYEAETGNLWIGTGERGLFCLKNGIISACETGASFKSSTINTLYKDRQENLWIGTDGGGLLRLKGGGNANLACGSVYAITEDREGCLWVGTLDRGLFQLRDSKFVTYTVGDGLSHDIVRYIYEDLNNVTWVGTEGGLDCIKDGKPAIILTTRGGLLNNTVSSLGEDSEGNLWIGTWGGLHKYKDGQLTTFTVKDGLSDSRIKCILIDRQGNAWIGTENGLNRYDLTSAKFELFNTSRGLSGNSIEFIYEDSKGELWIGADAGLNRLSAGVISPFKLPGGEDDYFLKCAYEDKEGTLWFGTDRGLIRAQGKEVAPAGALLKITRSRITENDVATILEDDNGYLWLGGRKGISRLAKKELAEFVQGKTQQVNIETYNEKDGMKSRWVIGPGCRAGDGRLWFPTSMGVAVIDPDRIKKETWVLSSIIEKLMVDGEIIRTKVFQGGQGAAYVELAPGKKRLEIYYTSVSFSDPKKIRFKIKLEGYDDDWVDVGVLRNTAYYGLKPGHYTFKVIAGNQGGAWNPEGAALTFCLRPYFYQTVWFYIAIVMFVLAAVFTFYHIRVGRLKAREKELNELVKSRTAELEAQSVKLKAMDKIKSRFFANISHEFRTPLTLILGPLEQMLTGPQEKEIEQKKKIKLMMRNSRRLLGMINQLLDLSKFDSGTMKLQVLRQDIVPFLKGVFHSFDYDPLKMEEVIANLLSNAVKFTPAGGRITLSVEVRKVQPSEEWMETQDILEISVSDTGPGIPPQEVAHIFDRFYQADSTYEYHRQGTGIGLAIAKEIIELHHGEIEAISQQEEGEGMGARFVIRLPMGKAHLKPMEIVDSITVPKPSAIQAPGEKEKEGEDEIEPMGKEGDISKGPEALGKDIILVIEDSADVRQYIRGALEPQYIVKEAKDGEEGLRLAGEMVPDLIICDVMMPGKDGFEVCRGIKSDRVTSHIPVILLTARAGEDSIVQGLETGADDYITKPFSTRILVARIKNLIELRRQFQQNLGRQMTLQPAKAAVSKIDQEFLRELQEVIEENMSDSEFNVERLSQKLYMSHATVYRKIQALTGENPGDFIRTCRLRKGAELLKDEKSSVLQVALDVGFSSAAYFTKCFKEKFQQLPSEYRDAGMER